MRQIQPVFFNNKHLNQNTFTVMYCIQVSGQFIMGLKLFSSKVIHLLRCHLCPTDFCLQQLVFRNYIYVHKAKLNDISNTGKVSTTTSMHINNLTQ